VTVLSTVAVTGAVDTPFRKTMRERASLFRGRVLASPAPRIIPRFSLNFDGTDTWRLTSIDPNVQDLQTTNGVLSFRLAADSVTLGWGNFEKAAQEGLGFIGWRDGAHMELRIRQEHAGAKPWQAQFRRNGTRDTGTMRFYMHSNDREGRIKLPGTESNEGVDADGWKRISQYVMQVLVADGLGLTIRGKKGSRVEIDTVRVVKQDNQLWARKTLHVPEEVFAAIATTSVCQDLWVNGQKAFTRIQTAYGSWYAYTTVDLKPLLKPGENVIAIYDPMDMPKTISAWMQGTVNTVSGQTIPIQTDLTWKTSGREEEGWQDLDFDDSEWMPTGDEDPMGYMKPGAPRSPVLIYDKHHIPAYAGRILLANPDGRKLFYTELTPVRFTALLPPAMARPDLRRQVWNEGTAKVVASGRARFTESSAAGHSYDIDLGRLPGGVYSLSLQADAEGAIPPLSRSEPFIVTRKVPMREVEGTAWDEGCSLRLVDDVDCTNPDDPHPLEDAGVLGAGLASRVVERHGLRYRVSVGEKDWHNRSSWFTYRVRFRNVNRPHWVVVDYPDDEARVMECEIRPFYPNTNKRERDTTSWASAGVVTGGRYPLSNQMQQQRILIWPQAEDAMVAFMKKFTTRGTVAAARIRVYEIDDLPALKVTPRGREFGLFTERPFVVAQSYGPSDFYNRAKNKNRPIPGELPEQCRDNPYLCWVEAAENYARYCRFTGQNVHFMGSFQYNRLNQGLTLDSGAEGCSLVPEFREVLVNVLHANGIDTYGVIEYAANFQYWRRGWTPLQRAGQGGDYMFQVDHEGYGQMGYCQSENHMTSPTARRAFLEAVGDVAERLAAYPGFKGLVDYVAPTWVTPGYYSEKTSYDDNTVALFEKETGITVPVRTRSLDRFAERHAWITENVREAWFDFRARKVTEVHRAMAGRLKRIRKDLAYTVVFEVWDRRGDPLGLKPQYDRGRGAGIRDILRCNGYDPLMFKREPDVQLGRVLWSYDHPENRVLHPAARWEYARDPEAVSLFNAGSVGCRTVFVRTGFTEGLIVSRWEAGKALWPVGHRIGYILPRAPLAMRRFAQVLMDSDVEMLPYGFSDCHAPAGSEDLLRAFAGELVSLPRGRFRQLTGEGFDPNVYVCGATIDGAAYAYLVNPGWWPIRVTVRVAAEGEITRTRTGTPTPLEDGALALALPPYGVLGLTAPGGSLALQEVRVAAPPEVVARIKAMFAHLEAKGMPRTHAMVKGAWAAWEAGDYARCFEQLTHWQLYKRCFSDWTWDGQ